MQVQIRCRKEQLWSLSRNLFSPTCVLFQWASFLAKLSGPRAGPGCWGILRNPNAKNARCLAPFRLSLLGSLYAETGLGSVWLDCIAGLFNSRIHLYLVAVSEVAMDAIKRVAFLFTMVTCAVTQDSRFATCLIVKHSSTAHQLFVNASNWQYVAGDFPKGMKWKSNMTDRNIRKVQENGGQVVVVQPNYTTQELKQAQASCKLFTEAPK